MRWGINWEGMWGLHKHIVANTPAVHAALGAGV